MVLFVMCLAGGANVIAMWVGMGFSPVDPSKYSTEAAYHQAVDEMTRQARFALLGAVSVASAALFWLLGRRTGYRGAGSLLVLTPVYGVVVMCRILWRCTDVEHWDGLKLPDEPYPYRPQVF